MTQALRNYRSQGGVIDIEMAIDIFVLFQEHSYGLSKDKCLQYLETILAIG